MGNERELQSFKCDEGQSQSPAGSELSQIAPSQLAPQTPVPAAPEPSLQSVSAPARTCAQCKATLQGHYYAASEQFICEDCKARFFDSTAAPGGLWAAFKSGSLVAMVGTLVWGTFTYVTGYELGLIAIAIGFFVGKAVRKGSAGLGGRKYQVLACVLTYLSITSSYVPLVLKGLASHEVAPRPKGEAPRTEGAISAMNLKGAALSPAPAPSVKAAPVASQMPAQKMTFGKAIRMLLLLGVAVWGLALLTPFLSGFENIMGIVIIGIGLWEAFKLNRSVVLSGPFAIVPAEPNPGRLQPAPETESQHAG